MNPDIAVGRSFPDFVLPDHTRTPRRLSDLQGAADLILLVLIRGFFCPKDREQPKALTAFHPQLVVFRRDRELSGLELKRQWNAGDKSNFYP